MNIYERVESKQAPQAQAINESQMQLKNNPSLKVIPSLNNLENTLRCEHAGGHFEMSSKGVLYFGRDKDNNQLPARWICARLFIVAKTRDAKSGEWGRLLEWFDDDNTKHQWAMPLALLQGDSIDVRRELARLGLAISTNRYARDLLASYLQIFPVEKKARCVDRLGWQGDVFVTPTESIGQKNEKIVFQNNNNIQSALSISGTTKLWRESISRLAVGNSRLVFAISPAFAPTLLSFVSEDSGGFHFRGASSSGKTTALKVAASVWGDPTKYSRLWRATANGLEGLAALHNDGLLVLDELSQIDPKEAGEAAYLLANGQGKTRSSRTGLVKQSLSWSLFFLSAGEESLSALMARAGQRTNPGQEIRLADIEADAGCNMGIFNSIHEYDNPASFSLALKDYTSSYHGAVGVDWLHAIVKHRSKLPTIILESINTFVQGFIDKGVSGQGIRVARRFALVAIARELATRFKLTGWSEGESIRSARACFLTWLTAFGDKGNREDKHILSQVRAFFESYGSSRFDDIAFPNNDRIQKRAGFFRIDVNDAREYFVLSEVFRKEVCKGFEPKTVIKVLRNSGWIKPGKDNKSSQKPRVRGIGSPRCYVFTETMWETDIN